MNCLICILVALMLMIGIATVINDCDCMDGSPSILALKMQAWEFAKNSVRLGLKAPSTAKFPWFSESFVSLVEGCAGNKNFNLPRKYPLVFRVSAYVDAENAFGAKIRTHFVRSFAFTDSTGWSLAITK